MVVSPTANGKHRVVELNLQNKGLDGTIPADLSLLRRLTHLRLGGNELTGEIPSRLGDLSFLLELRLQENQLTGGVPAELGDLSGLLKLSLRDNQLTGEIPAELGQPERLTELWLNGNQLTGEIPVELGDLSNLRKLSLRDNRLTGEIPAELGGLGELTLLALNGNQLSGNIPSRLGSLSGLTRLLLSDNRLDGSVPQSLGKLNHLETVRLAGNDGLECVPYNLRDVPKSDFDSMDQDFCPPTPEDLCHNDVVVANHVDNPALVADCVVLAEAPAEWDAWDSRNWSVDRPLDRWEGVSVSNTSEPRVTRLAVSNKNLVGTIPASLGSLTHLKYLDLSDNMLWHEIPDGLLGKFDQLRHFDLSGNSLSGSATLREGARPALRRIDLSGNSYLKVDVGGAISVSPKLQYADLSDTILEFEGLRSGKKVPVSAASLYHLNASSSSTPSSAYALPAWLGTFTNLRYLDLSHNPFVGQELPSWLGDLSSLHHLNLSGTYVTGDIPSELGNLTNLRFLKLDAMDAAGLYVTPIGLTSREYRLTGSIPTELGNLSNLRYLGLVSQGLHTVPRELGKLAALEYLFLADNPLRGYIPVELDSLNNLRVVSLSTDMLRHTVFRGGDLHRIACLEEGLRFEGVENDLVDYLGRSCRVLDGNDLLSKWQERYDNELSVQDGRLARYLRAWLSKIQ